MRKGIEEVLGRCRPSLIGAGTLLLVRIFSQPVGTVKSARRPLGDRATLEAVRTRVLALIGIFAIGVAGAVWLTWGNGEPSPVASPGTASPTPTSFPTHFEDGTASPTAVPSPTPEEEITPTETPAATPTVDGGGGGGGTGGGVPAPELTGTWSGTWANSTPDMLSGPLDITFEQHGSRLSGSLAMSGSPCLAYGTLSGTIDGARVEFRASEREITYAFTGRLSGDVLRGSYRTNCDDGRGTWEVVRVG
mgnify:CR=1 FL=1